MSEMAISSTLFITSIHQGKLGEEIEEQRCHLIVTCSIFDVILCPGIPSSHLDITKM